MKDKVEVLLEEINSFIFLLKSLRDAYRYSYTYNQNLSDNFYKFKENLKKLEESLENFKNKSEKLEDLLIENKNFLNDQYEKLFDEFKRKFGVELEKALRNNNLSLKGHYSDLKVGFFTLELDFESLTADIWFGPKQEKIANDIPLSVSIIVKKIIEFRNNLGSKMSEEQILTIFKNSYKKLYTNINSEKVPIIDFYKDVQSSMSVQLKLPSLDVGKDKKKRYSRADFAFDLYKLQKHRQIRLIIATRFYTKKRSNFLWVPSNDEGDGDFYSHIVIEEDGLH